MEKKESRIYLTKKKAHKDSIVSIALNQKVESHNVIATSSDDNSVRLWDLRMKSSVKYFSLESVKEGDVGNVVFNENDEILVCKGKNILTFDSKTDKIIQKDCDKLLGYETDEINQIAIDKTFKYLACCDDSYQFIYLKCAKLFHRGNTTIADARSYEKIAFLGKQHENISFSLDFVYKDGKPICVTSGFDCLVIFWDIEKRVPIKHVNLNEIAAKYIQGKLLCPPLIYSVHGNDQTILVSCETGHVFSLNLKEPKKPKYIIDGHLGKVMKSVFANFGQNQQYILTASNDLSFSMWDNFNKNQFGIPKNMKKIEIPNKPNWLESTKNNQILVSDISPELLIFDFLP